MIRLIAPCLARDSAAIWSVLIRIQYLAIGFLITVVAAKLLGPRVFGEYTFYMSIALVASGIALSGMVPLIVREAASTKTRPAIKTTVRRSSFLITAVLLSIFLIIGFANDEYKESQRMLSLSLAIALLISLIALFSAAVRGFGRQLAGQLPDLLIRPLILLALIWGGQIVDLNVSSASVLVAHSLAAGAALIVASVLYWTVSRSVNQDGAQLGLARWLRNTSRFVLVGWIGIVNIHAIIFLIEAYMGSSAVGEYRVAMQLSLLMTIGLSASDAIQAPKYVLAYEKGNRIELQRLISHSARLALFLAAPVAVVFIAFAETILNLVFGSAFLGGAGALRILALGQFLSACFGSVGTMLIGCGEEKSVVRASFFSFCILLSSSLILLPYFGLAGGAAAVSSALVGKSAYFAWQARLKFRVIALPIWVGLSRSDHKKGR